MAQMPLAAVLGGLGVGIAFIVMFALVNPADLQDKTIINSTTQLIISQSAAESSARDHLDRIAQSNGEQPGVYRGGMLGSANLIYVDKDGTNYLVDSPGGRLGEKLPYPIDDSRYHKYIWEITLNYGNSSKPEYIYAVDGYDGEAWMIGVID